MCLELRENQNQNKLVAVADIICYKRLRFKLNIKTELLETGDKFTGVINKTKCRGIISIDVNGIYFCTNYKNIDGQICKNRYGFKYSWKLDNHVFEIKIEGKKDITNIEYTTQYQHSIVEIGKTYGSKLLYEGGEVNIGLHSFHNLDDAKKYYLNDLVIVKCIIPKGSKYYDGYFDIYKSYASNKIKYVKLLEYI